MQIVFQFQNSWRRRYHGGQDPRAGFDVDCSEQLYCCQLHFSFDHLVWKWAGKKRSPKTGNSGCWPPSGVSCSHTGMYCKDGTHKVIPWTSPLWAEFTLSRELVFHNFGNKFNNFNNKINLADIILWKNIKTLRNYTVLESGSCQLSIAIIITFFFTNIRIFLYFGNAIFLEKQTQNYFYRNGSIERLRFVHTFWML